MQKVEFSPAVHLPFHQFQSMNLAFHLAVAPRQNDRGVLHRRQQLRRPYHMYFNGKALYSTKKNDISEKLASRS